ncbi:MAG TPA: ComEC/Rec2 family competence protein [Rhodoglobus sp.]|nr:ComEC/Rec2 family competence protein [Rhodoglobus sp.]HQI66804.1 ComEC/Rec2 family competence protein [Rhodoglobus sp.]
MIADLRLAIPAAVAWIAAAVIIGIDPVIPTIALWAAAGIATAIALARRSLAVVALALAAAAFCSTSVVVQSTSRQPAELVAAAETGRQIDALATLTGRASGRSYPVTLDVVNGTSVHVPVVVFGPATDAGIGTTVRITGTLTATDPGDDAAFLVFAERPPVVESPPPWYLDWANGLRARFLAQARGLPGDGGDLLAGLAIGDTTDVGGTLDQAMKSSSLSHLTAVSGANCAIVIGLVMVAGAAVGIPRWARVAASLAVLVGFVVLVTPEPSVLRAAVMASLVLATLARGRPVRGIPVLALATICLLAFDPWLARSYGFVLSVLATAGLLLLAGPLARVLERWLPRWLAIVIAVPFAAQLACQPVIILLSATLPTYGVVANVLAAPAAPIATVVGLAACVLLVLIPPLGALLCQLAWLPSAWIAAVAQFFASAPAAQLPWPPGAVGALLLASGTVLAVFAVLGRRWAVVALAVAGAVYLGLAGGGRIAQVTGRPDWQIAACDIGQGDAVFVRSRGELALVDTGPDPALMRRCMTELGIGRVDLLVLTHYDLDHVGGAGALVGKVDRVFVGPSSDPEDDRLRADLVAGGAHVEQVSRGPTGLLGDLRWEVLWPPSRLGSIEPGNPASVTLEFQPVGECASGCLSSIFLGDLGEDAQNRLLAAGPVGTVDVVKVAHHGSRDQSERLYERLHATVGVIGVGADNGYGHPTDDLLQILARAGTIPERTDLSGLILLAPGAEPGTVRVWSER